MFENTSEPEDRLYTRKEAARYLTQRGLPISAQTLARKFCEGTGPACQHVGHRAMYRKSALDAFFARQLSAPRGSSSEPRRPADWGVAVDGTARSRGLCGGKTALAGACAYDCIDGE